MCFSYNNLEGIVGQETLKWDGEVLRKAYTPYGCVGTIHIYIQSECWMASILEPLVHSGNLLENGSDSIQNSTKLHPSYFTSFSIKADMIFSYCTRCGFEP